MASYDNYQLLRDLTKHTNREFSYSESISRDNFPEQNTDYLNTTITVLIKDKRIVDNFEPEHEYRPKDDTTSIDVEKREPRDLNGRIEEEFVIIRCDAAEPYKLVGVDKEYGMIIVTSSKLDDNGELNLDCQQYGPQNNFLIGISCAGIYEGLYNLDGKEDRESYIIMSEIGEDCNSVIVEFLDEDTYRIVLEDEVEYNVLDDIHMDYDLTESDIRELRRRILGDKLPYGAN